MPVATLKPSYEIVCRHASPCISCSRKSSVAYKFNYYADSVVYCKSCTKKLKKNLIPMKGSDGELLPVNMSDMIEPYILRMNNKVICLATEIVQFMVDILKYGEGDVIHQLRSNISSVPHSLNILTLFLVHLGNADVRQRVFNHNKISIGNKPIPFKHYLFKENVNGRRYSLSIDGQSYPDNEIEVFLGVVANNLRTYLAMQGG